MNFNNSKCKGVGLHKFATIQAKEDSVLERCVKCGKKHVIKVLNGNPHITEYSRWHQREFLIPQHRLFAYEFRK